MLYVAIAVFLLLLGVAASWVERNLNLNSTKTKLIELEKQLAGASARLERLAETENQLQQSRDLINSLSAQNASLNTRLETSEIAHQEQVKVLTALGQEVQNKFKLLATDILRDSKEEFTTRASEFFTQHKELAKNDLSALVTPIGQTLQTYESALEEIEKARITGYAELGTLLRTLNAQNVEVRDVTANLVNALRAAPKTRGRWGEKTLQRVMELSGLIEHCDFETERHFSGEDETFRPDVVIQIAEKRTIVVDAKAATSAYIDAIEAVTDEDRNAHLKRHAKQLRERLEDLSSKSYWQKIPGSTDCVVMFVPGDNFIAAAFEHDRELFEDGFKNRVLICSPTTFIALAKAIAYGWRQEKLAENAIEVAKIGRELFLRLGKAAEHIELVGDHLKNSVKAYNKLVGTFESRVLPQARRFNELGIEGTSEGIPELELIDTVVRSIEQKPPSTDLLSPNLEGES